MSQLVLFRRLASCDMRVFLITKDMIFDDIKTLPISDIMDSLGIEYKKNGNELELYHDWKPTDGWRANILKWVIKDHANGWRAEWDRLEFVIRYLNTDKAGWLEWFKKIFHLKSDDKKKSTIRKRETFIEDMPVDNTLSILRRFLIFRGFTHDQAHTPYVDELAKELGAHERMWISDWVFKDTLLFPMLDEDKKRIGMKMRTIDGTEFPWTGKSGNVKWGNSWVLYGTLGETIIIVEWEVDYITLRALWFDSVIGNLGWVSANREKIKRLCKNAKRILVAYDNDDAGRSASIEMNFGRDYDIVQYPDNTDGCDINDLLKRGYNKSDFEKIFQEKYEQEIQPLYEGRFFWDGNVGKYYNTIAKKYQSRDQVLEDMKNRKQKIVKAADLIVPVYDGICFMRWGKKWYFNLFDERTILKPSENPSLHPDIGFLINNICGWNEENKKWLMEAILFKYLNPNNVRVPAVLFFGPWGTGKTLFIKLLAQIFGTEKIQFGLNQDSLDSRFSTDIDQKLIVEIKELTVTNTEKGILGMNKLKSIIFEDRIQKEKKGIDSIMVDHIAWYIMSSNNPRSIVLDSSTSGNRRFSIIKTTDVRIKEEKGREIENAIYKHSADFLAYLFENVDKKTSIQALENEEKDIAEWLNESISVKFFRWFEEKYPEINRITNQQRDVLFIVYQNYICEGFDTINNQFIKNFNNSLSPRYSTALLKIWRETVRGYKIEKEWRLFTDEENSTINRISKI